MRNCTRCFPLERNAAKNHVVAIPLGHVVVVVLFAISEVAPLVLTCVALDVFLQAVLRVVGLETFEVAVGDKAVGQVQEVVARLVQLVDVLAGGQDVLADELLLALGQWCHGVCSLLFVAVKDSIMPLLCTISALCGLNTATLHNFTINVS